jgi:ankyrin
MWAAAEHHPDVVRILIDAKPDIEARTKSGFTALHFAAREGDIESARLLLKAGVNINILSRSSSETSADSAPAGRRTNSATTSDGATPLLVATMRAQVPFALFLLEQGADANIADAGLTPLHWAAATWENGTANPVYGFDDPDGRHSRS